MVFPDGMLCTYVVVFIKSPYVCKISSAARFFSWIQGTMMSYRQPALGPCVSVDAPCDYHWLGSTLTCARKVARRTRQ